MPAVDPLSLIVTNNLLMVVVTVVLFASRIGLGSAARGARTWVCGDILVAAGRTLVVLAASMAGGLPGSSWAVASGALALSGLVAHFLATRRVMGHDLPMSHAALAMLVPAVTFAGPAWWMDAGWRVVWLHLHVGAMALAQAQATWPLRRGLGGRVILVVMGLAVAYNVAGALHVAYLGFKLPLHTEAGALLAIWCDLAVGVALSMGFLLVLQERMRERIEQLVVTDALTGALNRHGMLPLLTRELGVAERRREPLSAVMFDLDHFKRINDQHGHGVGDLVLAGFVARVRSMLRCGDLFGRWGGEEFLLVLPGASLPDAAKVANRLRQAIEGAPLAAGVPPVTVSGGVACALEPSLRGTADPAQRLLALIDLADQRLYVAKRSRNTVCAQTPVPAPAPGPEAAPGLAQAPG